MIDRLRNARVQVELTDGSATAVRLDSSGSVELGPLVVDVRFTAEGWNWTVASAASEPVGVMSVDLCWDAAMADTGEAPRFLRNGYQSWSPCAVARLGVDHDPSTVPGALGLVRGMHHADPRVAPDGWLRSELVTLLETGRDELLLVGFLGGSTHDGTIWARLDHTGHVELRVSAYLGGAQLPSGTERVLHPVVTATGHPHEASSMLERWADRTGEAGAARTSAPFRAGWCSWYHYFHDISETALRHNLALADAWPFEVFQLDDGYQADIGDWLATNDRFPSSLDRIAHDIASAGVTPGIWIAPFLAGPGSDIARLHPEWIAAHGSGRPLVGMVNPGWGGPVLTLDTTRPEVLHHIEATAAALVDAGFPYIKLDFTYAPSFDGVFADPALTPAERVRAGMEAVRRGAGEDAFLLGCGLPLGAGIGVVDGMRIGADVAPWWDVQPDQWSPLGYREVEPATRNAWVNTLTRSFMHRKLWLNDPDCLMLRTAETSLAPEAARAWAMAVGASGGMALVSDDLALLDTSARALLDDVLDLGHDSDRRARAGAPARCPDLLATDHPLVLSTGPVTITGSSDGTGATVARRR